MIRAASTPSWNSTDVHRLGGGRTRPMMSAVATRPTAGADTVRTDERSEPACRGGPHARVGTPGGVVGRRADPAGGREEDGEGSGVHPVGVKPPGPWESPEAGPLRDQRDRTRQGHGAQRERDFKAMPDNVGGARY